MIPTAVKIIPRLNWGDVVLNIQKDEIAINSNKNPRIVVNGLAALLLIVLCKSLNFSRIAGNSYTEYVAKPVSLL